MTMSFRKNYISSVAVVVFVGLLCPTSVSGLATRLLPASVLDTLQALDSDRSGRVEKAEIEHFARSQGLDTDKAVAEFRELDIDGSGDLDIQELSGTLTSAPADEQQEQTLPSQAWTPILPQKPASPTTPVAIQPAGAHVTSRTGALPFEVAAGAVAPPASPEPSPPATTLASTSPGMRAGNLLALGSLPLPHLENASMMLEVVSTRSQQIAARAAAEAFSRQAEQVMEHRKMDDEKAWELQATAQRLRQNASALLQTSAEDAGRAARDAMQMVVAPAAAQVRAIELEAQQAMDEAATQRGQAAKAMERALKVQAELSEKVGHQLRYRSQPTQSSE